MADDERNAAAAYHISTSPPAPWGPSPHVYPHSHHGTPAQEYSGFSFGSPPMAMDSNGTFTTTHHHHQQHQQHRHMPQQLQPLVMPQWPSMLNIPPVPQPPANNYHQQPQQPVYHTPVQPSPGPVPLGPLQTPVSASSNKSLSSTPRKTLTDVDRKRMCLYAEEHPNAKQMEIGGNFGLASNYEMFTKLIRRLGSTVSKVLRQKEKYLQHDDGSRSPIKRAKGRLPDIERALAVWAKNQEKKGLPLTDEMIRNQARAFSATTTTPENQQTLSSSWIEKFKLKNNLLGARSRKSSLAPDDADAIAAMGSAAQTGGGNSPVSPTQLSPPSETALHSAASLDSLKNDSPDGPFAGFASGGPHGGTPFHSHSLNSSSSAFTDAPLSSFSPGPLSPTSPFFTPDSGTAPSPFVPGPISRPIAPGSASGNLQRPRSSTFPRLDQYMGLAGIATDASTPKYVVDSVLDSPMEEPPDPLANIAEAMEASSTRNGGSDRPRTITPSETTMRPPPLPAHVYAAAAAAAAAETSHNNTATIGDVGLPALISTMDTSPEEAHQALTVVFNFFKQQPTGFLDFQESYTMGKLMEKLKLHSSRRNS